MVSRLVEGQPSLTTQPPPPPLLASKKQIELKPQPQKIGLCELFSKT